MGRKKRLDGGDPPTLTTNTRTVTSLPLRVGSRHPARARRAAETLCALKQVPRFCSEMVPHGGQSRPCQPVLPSHT